MAISFRKGVKVRRAHDLSDDLLKGITLEPDPIDGFPSRKVVLMNGKRVGWIAPFDGRYWNCSMLTKTGNYQSWGITDCDHSDWQTPAKSVWQHYKEHYRF
jgi:hypothetical protein